MASGKDTDVRTLRYLLTGGTSIMEDLDEGQLPPGCPPEEIMRHLQGVLLETAPDGTPRLVPAIIVGERMTGRHCMIFTRHITAIMVLDDGVPVGTGSPALKLVK